MFYLVILKLYYIYLFMIFVYLYEKMNFLIFNFVINGLEYL